MDFGAPWSLRLVFVSLGAGALLLIVAWLLWRQRHLHYALRATAATLPLVILVGAALNAVLGYRLDEDGLHVRRLLWTTPVDLGGLLAAERDPDAMKGSRREWGNGGLFSFTGRYRSDRLGPYNAYVTDLRRTVVLHLGDRTVVVSPTDPAGFLQRLRTHPVGYHLPRPSASPHPAPD